MSPVEHLASIVLPSDTGLLRNFPQRAGGDGQSVPAQGVWADYDRRTLIYDAVHLRAEARVRLFLPRLLNLSMAFHAGRFEIDGSPVRLERPARFRRFECFDLVVPQAMRSAHLARLSLDCPGLGRFESQIRSEDRESFREARVIYTLIRNEKLEWIRDWMQFHHRQHGADAVLIADNGSTTHDPIQLLEVLNSVPGYRVCRVLSAPLPWGARGAGPGVDDGKYLQTTLLNLTRDRFFRTAAAVLNVDIDELVVGPQGQSIFSRAQRWGYVTFPGVWRYAHSGQALPRHAGHLYARSSDKPCATKYCYRPNSLLGRRCLSVHSIEGLSRKLFSSRGQFFFLHCRNISTNWKSNRLADTACADMPLDPATAHHLTEGFGAPIPDRNP